MSQRLCSECESIDITGLLTKSLAVSKDFIFGKNLGPWRAIKAKASFCNFCRLVVASIQSTYALEPNDDVTVKLNHARTWRLAVAHSNLDGAERAEHWSNQYDIKSHVDKFQVDVKYCLTVKIASSREKVAGVIQCLANTLVEADVYSFMGRPVARDCFHADLSTHWLARCRQYHQQSCGRAGVLAKDLPANFRVIDMEQRLIVPYPHGGCQYAVLSYVWGEKEMSWRMPRTQQRDVRRDTEGREVIHLPQILPATIADSMNVAMHMGFRYIWVDAFCIVQDDDQDKVIQIPHMDAVYSCAEITIAAGCSGNADFGLHGISQPRCNEQVRARVDGKHLAAVLPQYETMDEPSRSIWNTRGWTLQEKVFSRRTLLFTDTQVFFKCKNSIWSEDIRMETRDLSQHFRRRQDPLAWVADRSEAAASMEPRSSFQRFMSQMFSPSETSAHLGQVLNYVAIIEMYTKRELTDHRDTLTAIDGILRTLKIGVVHEGIPSEHFRFLLLWHPAEASACTRATEAFPSWTWAAYEFDQHCSWSSLNSTKPYADLSHTNTKSYTTRVLDLAAEKDDSRFGLITNRGYQKIGSSTYDHAQLQALKSKTQLLSRCMQDFATLLRFECEVYDFRLGHPAKPGTGYADQDFVYHKLEDKLGFCLGEAVISPILVAQQPKRMISCLRVCRGEGIKAADIAFTYVPIKNYYYPGVGPNDIGEYSSLSHKDGETGQPQRNYLSSTYPVVHVMLVEWLHDDQEPGLLASKKFCRRLAVGRVMLEGWEKASADGRPFFDTISRLKEVFIV